MAVEVETMEIKKATQQVTSDVSKDVKDIPVSSRKARDFLGDVKAELSKITWTTPEELKTYTKIVVAATFCFGMGVYFIDLIIQAVLTVLESTVRLIGG